MLRLRNIFGVAGIDPRESFIARRTAFVFQWILILVAFWLPIQRYLEIVGSLPMAATDIIDWIIWGIFIIEVITLTILVKRRWLYLTTNWLSLAIVVIAFPIIWEEGTYFGILKLLRLIVLIYIVMPWGKSALQFMSAKRLGTTIVIFVIITILTGIFLSYIDPGIGSPWNGIWWAFQTITTLGYGDVVPETRFGQLFAMIFMVMGVGLLASLSASFAYLMLNKKREIAVEKGNERMMKELIKMNQKIESLEKKLDKKA